MGKKLMITPTCETPEQGITGVLVNGNIFVPTYEMPGMINTGWVEQRTVPASMTVTWPNMSSFSGTYVEKGTYDPANGQYNYFQKSDNSGYYLARREGNLSTWNLFTNEYWGWQKDITTNGLLSQYDYFATNTTGSMEVCPKTGWFDYYNYYDYDNSIVTDVMPVTKTTLNVNDCGINAKYEWNYMVALNSGNTCKTVVMNQKTDLPYIVAESTQTENPVAYIADVSVIDKMTGENTGVITRCFFTKQKVIRYSTRRYVAPVYSISP